MKQAVSRKNLYSGEINSTKNKIFPALKQTAPIHWHRKWINSFAFDPPYEADGFNIHNEIERQHRKVNGTSSTQQFPIPLLRIKSVQLFPCKYVFETNNWYLSCPNVPRVLTGQMAEKHHHNITQRCFLQLTSFFAFASFSLLRISER